MIDRHEIHALSVDDGSERAGWPVDAATISSGGVAFTAPPQNQRGALSLVNGVLYVPYGGHVGDCGPYHGWVLAIDTKDPSKRGGWATGGQGEGIWAAGGMASDGNGVFAVTGNNTAGATTHLDSEELVRITGLGALDRSSNKDFYYPEAWFQMDVADLDFGSVSPVLIEVPGATPSTMVAAVAKTGHLFLLDSKNLGGLNGQLADYIAANSAHTVPAAYTTARGVYVTFTGGAGVGCPSGSPGSTGTNVVSVLIPPGSPPVPQTAWCAQMGGQAAPIVTTTDGKSDAIVWFVDVDFLVGVDGETGAVLFTGNSGECALVHQWTSPIVVKGRVISSADGHLCAWSPTPPTDAAAGG
jgi:hypothetical protein